MTLADFLSSHARGKGKTHNLATLVKELKGTLIVRNQAEAARVEKEYGIKALPFSVPPEKIMGRTLGITYVDPDAVGLWVHGLERENENLRKALREILYVDSSDNDDVEVCYSEIIKIAKKALMEK